MGNQTRITEPCELLDAKGHITHEGYATSPLWRYDRSKIKAGWYRIKEWEYYCVMSPERNYGITVTIADLGYIGLAAVCWIDLNRKTSVQLDTMSILPMGRMNFPPTSTEGSVLFEDKKLKIEFKVSEFRRYISVEAPAFETDVGKGLTANIELRQPRDMESMVIATSWKENRKAFYYNHKINCLAADGTVTIGDQRYTFSPTSCFGGLDWGRGNWTYKNRWYWGSASGLVDEVPVGWNIGYGFSDRTPASENMVFYDGRAHKLDEVTFHMNTNDYLQPWKFTSNDGRFELDFNPVLDRSSAFNFLIIKSVQHQVFGRFNGQIILDSGDKLLIENFLGFAEDVLNWY